MVCECSPLSLWLCTDLQAGLAKQEQMPFFKPKKHPRARNNYDDETAYESYMFLKPGFQSGLGDSVDAD